MALGRFKFFPLFLGIISCLSLIVCVITDYWYVIKRSKDEQTNEGLWKICDSVRCKKISGNIEGWAQAVRGFLIMSILTSSIAIIFYFIALRFVKLKAVYPCGLLITSMLIIFSMTVYGIKKKTVSDKQLDVEFGYSYMIGWASGSLCTVATIFAIYDVRKRRPAATTTTTTGIAMETTEESQYTVSS
ncbi:epithelial membrane protein 1-like [Rhopilema esculentum]|uniref:epithelial membrane protein 1-like n=1 Tax=Rhopilema esculentum TaxID=499914 RepID=UPI0031D67974